jgi:hypothetical protein
MSEYWYLTIFHRGHQGQCQPHPHIATNYNLLCLDLESYHRKLIIVFTLLRKSQ